MQEQVFADRRQAGAMLAAQLADCADRPDAIVLALPRGGVPVGYALASALRLPLDVLMVRKLGMPGHEEFAMGAIAEQGPAVISEEVLRMTGLSQETVREVQRREVEELRRREQLYHDDRPRLQPQGRTVILVDDGMATGSTMLAAVRALRARGPQSVIVAVPVASQEACALLASEADRVVCLCMPEWFRAVSLWYREFGQTADEEVQTLLRQAAQERGLPVGEAAAAKAGEAAQGTIGANQHHEE